MQTICMWDQTTTTSACLAWELLRRMQHKKRWRLRCVDVEPTWLVAALSSHPQPQEVYTALKICGKALECCGPSRLAGPDIHEPSNVALQCELRNRSNHLKTVQHVIGLP